MLVFCYGTLKRGYGNNHRLGNAELLGDDLIKDHCLVYAGGRGSFPFALKNEGTFIKGEVYDIKDSKEILRSLDNLEGHPNWYIRTPAETETGRKVQFYLMPDKEEAKNWQDRVEYCDFHDNIYEWNRL